MDQRISNWINSWMVFLVYQWLHVHMVEVEMPSVERWKSRRVFFHFTPNSSRPPSSPWHHTSVQILTIVMINKQDVYLSSSNLKLPCYYPARHTWQPCAIRCSRHTSLNTRQSTDRPLRTKHHLIAATEYHGLVDPFRHRKHFSLTTLPTTYPVATRRRYAEYISTTFGFHELLLTTNRQPPFHRSGSIVLVQPASVSITEYQTVLLFTRRIVNIDPTTICVD